MTKVQVCDGGAGDHMYLYVIYYTICDIINTHVYHYVIVYLLIICIICYSIVIVYCSTVIVIVIVYCSFIL